MTKDQSSHCHLCLYLERPAVSGLKSLKSMPNSGTRRTFGRKLAGQETFEEFGHTLVCGPWWGCTHECSGIWLMSFQEHSWQLTKCCGNGGSSWRTQMSLLPSGRARQRTQRNTGQSASHQLLGRCWSNRSYKTFPNIQRTRRWLEIASMYLYRKKWHTTSLTTFWDDFLSTLNNDAWFWYDTSCSGMRLQKTLSRMKCEKDDFKET